MFCRRVTESSMSKSSQNRYIEIMCSPHLRMQFQGCDKAIRVSMAEFFASTRPEPYLRVQNVKIFIFTN